jgi:hypothetical protein
MALNYFVFSPILTILQVLFFLSSSSINSLDENTHPCFFAAPYSFVPWLQLLQGALTWRIVFNIYELVKKSQMAFEIYCQPGIAITHAKA